jgi:hypothetical protein
MLHVSPTLALRVDIGLGILGLLLAASAIWAIVLGIRKDWSRARRVAVWTFWLSASVQVLAWFAVPIAVVKHGFSGRRGFLGLVGGRDESGSEPQAGSWSWRVPKSYSGSITTRPRSAGK